jgi:hypothetical protein
MATVNQTLSCTGTAVPIVRKLPTKVQTASGTAVSSVLKIPGKVLTRTAVSAPVISLLRFGIDSFDVVEVGVKWFVSEAEGWKTRVEKRFGVMIRGKPSA